MAFNKKESYYEKCASYLQKKLRVEFTKDKYNSLMSILLKYCGNEEHIYTTLVTVVDNYYDFASEASPRLMMSCLQNVISELYPLLVKSDNDLSIYLEVVKKVVKANNVVKADHIKVIDRCFDNKKIIPEVIDYLNTLFSEKQIDNSNEDDKVLNVLNFLVRAREYYVDDRAMFTSFISFFSNLDAKSIFFGDELNDLIEAKLKEIKKANGVYDIDQETLLEYDHKIESLGILKHELDAVIAQAEETMTTMQNSLSASKRQMRKILLEQLRNLKQEGEVVIKSFNTTYAELMNSQASLVERDAKVNEIISRFESEKGSSETIIPVSTVATPMPSVVIPVQADINRPVDYTVNYYFDNSKKFKERFKELMEKKAALEETGEVFHEVFDDVLTMILQNDTPYLYGPSGCGKTYMIKEQIPKLLGVDVVTNGFIRFEQDAVGYTNAGTGAYVPSITYRCYKYGKFCFYDELDKSNPHAANILLPFISREKDSTYTFPDGVTVRRHPNFRIITAGNTRLTGSTQAYNTSQKLDEALNQRIMPVNVDYDNRIEKEILHDYPEWFEFITNYREALEKTALDGSSEKNSIGTITCRDVVDIKDHLDADSFSVEKLLQYHFIETKDADYLNQIVAKIDSDKIKSEKGKMLLKTFKKETEEHNRRGY